MRTSRPPSAETGRALPEGEAHFRLFVEQVVDYAMLMLDPSGRVVTWNRGAERIKGYRAEEILGEHFSRFYPEEDVRSGKPERELEVALRDGRFEDEGWRIRKDGTRFWANVVITPVRDDQGRHLGFAKVTRDLTERRRAEEERIRLQQQLATREANERIVALLRRLHALAGSLAAAETPDQVADLLVKQGAEALGASSGVLAEPRDGALEIVGSFGIPDAVLAQWRRVEADDRTLLGQVFLSGAPNWIESREELRSRIPAEIADLGADESAAALPLMLGARVLGAVSFRFDDVRVFPPEERALLEAMAAHAAQALERAHGHAREVLARASLTTTLRSIGDAVIAADATGAVSLMNAVAEELTGWPEDEARGRPLAEIFHIINEHTRAPVRSPVDKVLELGVVVGLANHTVLVSRDGREIPIDDSGAPIKSGGTIEGVVLVFRDVAEKKREEKHRAFLAEATAALAESLEYEVTIRKVAHLAVPALADWCAVDLLEERDPVPRRLAVVHIDPAKVAMASELDEKYAPKPFSATRVANVLRTGKSELFAEISEEQLALRAVDPEHLRLLRALGPRSAMIVPLAARDRVLGAITLVRAESGGRFGAEQLSLAEELARRCALAIDNARLFASEQRSREAADVANRAKDEFLAMVSHELRTPLNAILGWARMLATSSLTEPRRAGALETIERNAVAMAQLIEDLLDMSRVISGKMRLEVQPVDLGRVTEAAIESIKPAADVKNVRIVPALEASLPAIRGDPTRLQQVVWNLLSNAVKFTSRDGRIDVLLRRIRSSIELAVSDTGKGIDPSFLPQVFDPFRQEDASYTRTRGGLGLGLAITRQLVELHGGRIEAESAGEGKGATFRVSLPVAAVLATDEAPSPSSRAPKYDANFARPPALEGVRILVVEDDMDARRLIAAILQDCSCKVTTATSVDEAMAAIEREPPDILVSDIGLPENDGIELIRRVRMLSPDAGGDMPAAALTAYARAEDRRVVLNAGYSMHITKPIEPADLVAVVASLTRFARSRQRR